MPLPLRPALLALLVMLGGCATRAPAPPVTAAVSAVAPMHAAVWQPVALPGKTPTDYRWTQKDGRPALAALSDSSASMYRQQLQRTPQEIGEVSFSWWVQDLIVDASVAHVEREDAPARLMFGFAGDIASLPLRTRVLFELAEAITGEKPPYATLMYVWDARAPVGSVIINPRSDRIRKIVVDSGPDGLRRWREHRRDLAADFRLAFGEPPGRLESVAVMTDSDNTRSSASSWYGPVQLHGPHDATAPPRGK